MFKKIKEEKQQWIRFLFGSFTATALMFTFQACYGMPQPFDEYNSAIHGTVVSAKTGKPIAGIVVSSDQSNTLSKTGTNGNFILPVYSVSGQYSVHFSDEDGELNGAYLNMDTTLSSSEIFDDLLIQLNEQVENR